MTQSALEIALALVLMAAAAAFIGLGLFIGIRLFRRRHERLAIPLSPPGPKFETLSAATDPKPEARLELSLGHLAWWKPSSWALGLGFGSWLLLTDPEALGTAWISWPAALGLALAAPIAARNAWLGGRSRLIASSAGVTLCRGRQETTWSWSAIRAVRLMTYWRRGKESLATNAPTVSYIERTTLQFLDAKSAVLLEVDEPLRPAAAYAVFLATVPVWCGAAVTRQL